MPQNASDYARKRKTEHERPSQVENQADLFHWEGNVLVSLNFDLAFEVSFGEARGHLNDLRNCRIAADRDGNIRCLCASAFDRAANGFADGFSVNNRFLADGTGRCWLRGLGLDSKALSALRQFRPGLRGLLGRDSQAFE